MQGSMPLAVEAGPKKAFHPTSRQILRALETMTGVGFFTLHFADGKVRASEGLHGLVGTPEHVGTPITLDFIAAHTHPEDRVKLVESFHMLMRDTLPVERSLRLVRPDGMVRRLELRFERLVDEARRPVGWIICALDRSEEESLRKNLLLMRQRLRAVLDRLDVDLAWFGSANGKLIERALHGRSAEMMTAPLFSMDGWFASVHPDDRAKARANLDQAEANVTEVRMERAPGQYVQMRTVRQPVLDDDGALVEWLGLTTLIEPGRSGLGSEAVAQEDLLNGPLLRAARNLLGWTIPVLAAQSGISASTIMRIEETRAPIMAVARRSTAERLTRAVTAGGVIFHTTLSGRLAISL